MMQNLGPNRSSTRTPSTVTVACVGMALMDMVFDVTELPLVPGKHFAHSYREVGGGIAANGAVTVARLGGQAVLYSRRGDDELGQRIGNDLRGEGVNIDGLETVPDCASALSCVALDRQGERLLINYCEPKLFAGVPVAEPGKLRQTNAILADLRWPSAAELWFKAAARHAIPALLDYDQSPYSGTAAALLTSASHVVFGQDALRELSRQADPAAGLMALAQRQLAAEASVRLAVTLGGDGVLWLTRRDHSRPVVAHLPAFAVAVVDTLAAGDVFHGALALALAEGQPFADGLRFASAASALKCARPGGRAGIPNRAEVEQLLQAHL